MCDECAWHHKIFLVQLYWHLAAKLYCRAYKRVLHALVCLRQTYVRHCQCARACTCSHNSLTPGTKLSEQPLLKTLLNSLFAQFRIFDPRHWLWDCEVTKRTLYDVCQIPGRVGEISSILRSGSLHVDNKSNWTNCCVGHFRRLLCSACFMKRFRIRALST